MTNVEELVQTEGQSMADQESYRRKISAEEAKKKYIFVLKDSLHFFPPQGKAFSLSQGSTEKKVFLESYRCTCRGPQLPHEHYFIRWDGIRFGQKVTITRDVKAEQKYLLVLR